MNSEAVSIAQRDEMVSDQEGLVISTILGSCISVSLWDPEQLVGGMNHLLLPELKNPGSGLNSTDAIAMGAADQSDGEAGAERARLRAKLFGGSSTLAGLTDVGVRNAEFGRSYPSSEGIPCDNESVGGTLARKIHFLPTSGAAMQKFVEEAPELAAPVSVGKTTSSCFRPPRDRLFLRCPRFLPAGPVPP